VKFCQDHWNSLRSAIDERGLTALVADSGEKAAANLASELADGQTIDNYDPLMSAHFAIASNAMGFIANGGGNPLVIMAPPPDHPEWGCPICYLNWVDAEHEQLCADPSCPRAGEPPTDFAWMIDRAADDQVEAWKAMGS
jgi:hypothetical protein